MNLPLAHVWSPLLQREANEVKRLLLKEFAEFLLTKNTLFDLPKSSACKLVKGAKCFSKHWPTLAPCLPSRTEAKTTRILCGDEAIPYPAKAKKSAESWPFFLCKRISLLEINLHFLLLPLVPLLWRFSRFFFAAVPKSNSRVTLQLQK